MLTKQRHEMILKLLEEKGSITVTEIRDLLKASESTVRRDITALDKEGRLVKVFGGAIANKQSVTSHEYTVAQKEDFSREEKEKIGKFAASFIEPEDFIYLDAGTTTAYMLNYIEEKSATYVTNAVVHAQRLVAKGMKVLLIGGELKASTEAVIGSQAVQTIKNYHFTKGFFGVNGVTKQSGFTTPDASEAAVKQTAVEQCIKSFILCDYSKFDEISSVTFASFYEGEIITDRRISGYEDCKNIMIAR